MNETKSRFSLTRAASITGQRGKQEINQYQLNCGTQAHSASAGRMFVSLSVGIFIAVAASAQDSSSSSVEHVIRVPVAPVVSPSAAAFPLRDVHLLDGPLKHSQDIAAIYLLSL